MSDKYTLHLGDCIDVMRTLPDASIDLTVTSPPYDNLRTYGKDFDAASFDWRSIIADLYRLTKPGGVVVWVVADATINGSETGTSFRQALYAMECGFNLHDTMIWNRPGSFPESNRYHPTFEYMFVFSVGAPRAFHPIMDRKTSTGGTFRKARMERQPNGDIRRPQRTAQMRHIAARYNIWEIGAGYGQCSADLHVHQHPAIFPESLARDHIISWSNEGDTVLDPMMGSGTTGKMAVTLGRKFVGIELDAEYFAIAQERIEKATWQLSMFDLIAAD